MDYSEDVRIKERMMKDMAGSRRLKGRKEDAMVTIDQARAMLTVREVSKLLHVHGNTLRRWSDQGVIKAYRIGPRGDRRFRAEDIAVLLLEADRRGLIRVHKTTSVDTADRYVRVR